MVQELAVLGGPSDLHDAGRDDGDLVVPDAGMRLKRAAHAFERGRVATSLVVMIWSTFGSGFESHSQIRVAF